MACLPQVPYRGTGWWWAHVLPNVIQHGLLNELVVALADVGLLLHEGEMKLLTTQTQPPKILATPRGVSVAVVDRPGCHKWFGCILSGNGSHRPDREYHLQAASRAFFANRNILCNKAVSIRKKFLPPCDKHFFDKILFRTLFFLGPFYSQMSVVKPPTRIRRQACGWVQPHAAQQTGWTYGMKFLMTGMLG